jgi:hypothetical protein
LATILIVGSASLPAGAGGDCAHALKQKNNSKTVTDVKRRDAIKPKSPPGVVTVSCNASAPPAMIAPSLQHPV